MDKEFICRDCGKSFTLAKEMSARYPNWTPKQCLDCRNGEHATANTEEHLGRSEVLARYREGPDTGVFTDGFCEPNPGIGGWGAVKVVEGEIVAERAGYEPETTNNRMELEGLIEGYKMLGPDEELPVYTDSQLCVNTVTKWAKAWKRQGWTRGKKREPVMNLGLVQELYELAQSRPKADLQWIKGHAGLRWNEYADALSRSKTPQAQEQQSA